MRSLLRTFLVLGSTFAAGFALVGCDDASKPATAPDVKAGDADPGKNAMEPPTKPGGMETTKPGGMETTKPGGMESTTPPAVEPTKPAEPAAEPPK